MQYNLRLTENEKQIIVAYKKLNDEEKKVVCRMLSVDYPPSTAPKKNQPIVETLSEELKKYYYSELGLKVYVNIKDETHHYIREVYFVK